MSENRPPETAHPLLINRAIITDQERILFLQRANDDSYNPGLWEFPGGKVDKGEEMEAGLAREVREETGYTVEFSSTVAHIESEVITTGKYAGRLYVALFRVARVLDGDLQLSFEHQDATWERSPYEARGTVTPETKRALLSLHDLGVHR